MACPVQNLFRDCTEPSHAETTLWLRRDVDLKVHPQPVQSLEEVRAHP